MKMPFIDGEREVPDHIAMWLTDVDTARLTFEEAITEMNHKQEREYINRMYDRAIAGHFSERQ